ncbi:hypothetical protein K466DRAFT_148939 [Polyporus arcularius HHB13444]|uniref:Uncharacterized protein n=1 Tax=Polyporus arcularius HHB13444 TaxID=1314778 RepID=A0A5C3PBC7_9APHY|nr:hypothetical protein K466DRAFT_148939 [Polyporus arcularius HHB13444]
MAYDSTHVPASSHPPYATRPRIVSHYCIITRLISSPLLPLSPSPSPSHHIFDIEQIILHGRVSLHHTHFVPGTRGDGLAGMSRNSDTCTGMGTGTGTRGARAGGKERSGRRNSHTGKRREQDPSGAECSARATGNWCAACGLCAPRLLCTAGQPTSLYARVGCRTPDADSDVGLGVCCEFGGRRVVCSHRWFWSCALFCGGVSRSRVVGVDCRFLWNVNWILILVLFRTDAFVLSPSRLVARVVSVSLVSSLLVLPLRQVLCCVV